MSESSSDTESSCGWTIISNEGSDIETLGPESVPDGGPDGETAHGPSTGSEGVPDPSDTISGPEQESTISPAECSEEAGEHSADSTLKHGTSEETLPISEAGGRAAAEGGAAVEVDHVTLSCSDHSDIMTLEPLGAEEPEERAEQAEQAVSEEASAGPEEALYLGTSSSSQYSFGTVEASPLPASPPGGDTTSSSEAEGGAQSSGTALRRRRTRRNTAPASEPEEGCAQEELPTAPPPHQGQVSGTLNKCILLALVIAISMGFGHFYGTMQVQERQKVAEKLRESELTELRGDLHECQREQDIIAKSKEAVRQLQEDLEEKRDMVLSLTGLMDKIAKENQQLRLKQAELQAQKEDLSEHLQGAEQEARRTEARERHLETENEQLRSHLEREEESVSSLQDELRRLRAQMRSLEEHGGAADGVLSENRRLKGHLEDERQRLRAFLGHKEALMAEAQMLRRELDRERGVTEQLKEEVEQLGGGGGGMAPGGEAEELQARLLELEKKLSFEQQRSDLWERLYVESKEEKTRGQRGPRAGDKVGADGVMGKVKETFDAVKNSTKEFVHHHKEQIKKAKEAVKENLRKFSDSVKSTFRHFKDSARRVLDKVRRPGHHRHFQERKDGRAERCAGPRECSGEHKAKDAGHGAWAHKPLHQHPRKSEAPWKSSSVNTRKPGAAAPANPDQAAYKASAKGCSGVFDCAYQESMSLFNKALEPIQADEFIQLIRSYLQQEVDHFHHWGELESFINGFFHNGVFIHDQMLFTDFVSGVEDYLEDMDEYQRYDNDVFEDLDDFVYRHFFGDSYSKHYGPSGAFEGPMCGSKDEGPPQQRQQKLPRARPRPQADRKWVRSGRGSGTHVPNVKIELGPVPFDPKY